MHSNQENFHKICLKIINNQDKKCNVLDNTKYIKNNNYYYTAKTLNDYTTWSKHNLHPIHNVICKYNGQCEEAYENLELWNNNYKWKYNNNYFYLE